MVQFMLLVEEYNVEIERLKLQHIREAYEKLSGTDAWMIETSPSDERVFLKI